WAKSRFYFIKLLATVSAIIITLIIFVFAIPKVRMNFENVVQTTFSKNENELDSEDGSASRLVAWKTAFTLVKQHFLLGVGTGDVKQYLSNEYKNKGFWHAYEIKLNAHNQFLQTTLAIGLAGFVALVLFILINFKNAFKHKNILHLVFIGAVTLQFIVEASLETQAGVIFIAFFNSAFNLIFKQSNTSI
ncbi:MAG: O-antigen ligase family protein, partial [Bacteroidia bacterium]